MTLQTPSTPELEPPTQATSSARRAWIIAAVVVFGWGINFVFAKHALNQFDLATFNVFRFTGMAGLGWIVLAVTGQIRPIEPHHRKPMVLVAFV